MGRKVFAKFWGSFAARESNKTGFNSSVVSCFFVLETMLSSQSLHIYKCCCALHLKQNWQWLFRSCQITWKPHSFYFSHLEKLQRTNGSGSMPEKSADSGTNEPRQEQILQLRTHHWLCPDSSPLRLSQEAVTLSMLDDFNCHSVIF